MPDYIGTAAAERIAVDRGPGLVLGLGGDDTLTVAAGNGTGPSTLDGGEGNDLLLGGSGRDSLTGGAGADTLDGGVSEDTLAGGAGADFFTFNTDHVRVGGTTPLDVITDWSAEDRLAFDGGYSVVNYRELTAISRDLADAMALATMGSGSVNVVVVAVGADLIVYGSRTRPFVLTDLDGVILTGRTLNDISAANFTVPAASDILGTAGPDTIILDRGSGHVLGLGGDDVLIVTSTGSFILEGGDGNDKLFGANGTDSLSGGAGDDTLEGGGLGADSLSGGAGRDLFSVPTGQSGDIILDWSSEDRIDFHAAQGAGYTEITAPDVSTARTNAAAAMTSTGAYFVAAAVGADVYVFGDTRGDRNPSTFDSMRLSGRTLADIDASNIVIPTPVFVFPTFLPTGAGTGPGFASVSGNMDLFQPGELIGALIVDATETGIFVQSLTVGPNDTPRLSAAATGSGFSYLNNQLVGGTGRSFNYNVNSGDQSLLSLTISSVSYPAAMLGPWIAGNAAEAALSTMLAGADRITGTAPVAFPGGLRTDYGSDLLRGYGGADYIEGRGGADTIFGGAGNDVILAGGSSTTYLRGDEGDDHIAGGGGFDDANGNMGNDTIATGIGDDYCVGGKDNDLLSGGGGYDLVYGNLGADTCDGGDGNDIVRGGQDNDIVFGGAGDDFVSGDKGDDTMVGGAGADIFHSFGDAGIDRVADFTSGQGDRVQLDPGTQFTVAQVGDDTVVSMVGGGRLILANIQMSSLTPGWIFGA